MDAALLRISHPHALPSNGLLERFVCIAAALSIPLTFSMYRLPLGGFVLRLSDALACGAIALTALVHPASLLVHWLRLGLIPLLIWLSYITVQGWILDVPGAAVKEAVQTGQVFLSCLVAALYCKEYPRTFRRWFIIGLLISALSTVIYHLHLGQITGYKLAGDGRYIFGNLSTVLLLLVFSQREHLRVRLLVLIVSLLPLVLSMERRGMLGVIAVLGMLLSVGLCRAARFRPSIVIATCALTGLTMVAVYTATTPMAFQQKLYASAPVDESEALFVSDTHRKSLLANGVKLVQARWAFGYGADQVKTQMADFYVDPRLANGTHNFYLDSAVKFGVLGCALLALLIATVMWQVHRWWGYSTEGFIFVAYALLTIGFMSDGAAVLVMLFSSLLLPELTRADRDRIPAQSGAY